MLFKLQQRNFAISFKVTYILLKRIKLVEQKYLFMYSDPSTNPKVPQDMAGKAIY